MGKHGVFRAGTHARRGRCALVMGDKEKAAGTVAVRARGNVDLGVMPLEAFFQKLASDIATKQ